MALAHLIRNGWSVRKAKDKFGEDQDFFSNGNYSQNTNAQGPNEPFLCEVCYCEYEDQDVVKLEECGHGLCSYCFTDYLKTKLGEGPRECVFSVCPT